MSRLLIALATLTFVAACDGTNPFMDLEDGVVESDAGADTDPDNIYATDLNADLTMNSFEYDDGGTPATGDDVLRINNIPFDNSDISGGGYTPSAATLGGSSFDVYESPTFVAADREYFAVFRRGTYSEVAAVGTGDYVQFGYGGATAQPLTSTNGIPAGTTETYIFTGDYAAVRTTTDQGGSADLEFVTGDATLFVDILDFDTTGAVGGFINNRELFDVNGTSLGVLGDFISLTDTTFNASTGVIDAATAGSFEGADENAAGQWQAVFAGPDGEEIAGFVVLEGTTTSIEVEDSLRETGVFIVEVTP
jgi:hypothetical protein